MVGDSNLNNFQVEGELPDAFDPGGLDPESLASRAFSSNPNLIEQEATVDVGRAQAQSARRAHWPPLTISFSARQSTFGDEYAAFADPFPDRSRSGSAGFGVTIPILQGFTNKAIGVQLGISDRTVQGHLAHIFNKLQAGSRTEAVIFAMQHDLP